MKLKQCSVCLKFVPLWKSKPPTCKSCMARQPIKQKAPVKKESKAALNVFFASQTLLFPTHCENCGIELKIYSSWERRKSTAHILPKSETSGFPEVATHPQNRIFLCCDHGGHCHGNWDNKDAEARKNMKVYNLAIERYELFKSNVKPERQRKARIYLGLEDK